MSTVEFSKKLVSYFEGSSYDGNEHTRHQQYLFYLLQLISEAASNLYILSTGGNYAFDDFALKEFSTKIENVIAVLKAEGSAEAIYNHINFLSRKASQVFVKEVSQSPLKDVYIISEILRGEIGSELGYWPRTAPVLKICYLDKGVATELFEQVGTLNLSIDFTIKDSMDFLGKQLNDSQISTGQQLNDTIQP